MSIENFAVKVPSPRSARRAKLWQFALVSIASANLFAAREGLAAQVHVVGQEARTFSPSVLVIQKGDTVRIVNNDGDLLHHGYVESPSFNFDSGGQDPGSSTDIVFTEKGTFEVRCGIHPKMLLVVTVK